MSAFSLIHFGRLGFVSRNLSRCAYHPVFDPEPLERRKLLATGPVIGPVPLPNPAPPIATAPIAPPPVPTASLAVRRRRRLLR